MKKITIPFLFLLMSGLFASLSSNAQNPVRRSNFRVDAPADISGYKVIEEADMAGTSPWGSEIDSTWLSVPVGFDQSNPEGCTAFAPNTFAGKFALVFRGNCEFGAKALAAQNAGAIGVIIVNNLLGVAGMGAGVSGASVTVPVVMVTNVVGNEMKTKLVAGTPVNISLTNWRMDSTNNPLDLGWMNDGPLLPIAKCLPKHQTDGSSDTRYQYWAGGRFYNFSTDTFSTLFQKGVWSYRASLTSGAFAPLDSNSVNWSFATPVQSTDSILTIAIDTLSGIEQGFDMNDAAKGTYTMVNTIEAIGDFTEDAVSFKNNLDTSIVFAISDSIYSKGQYDFVNNKPVVNGYVNFGTTGSEWGPIIDIRNGGYSAKKVQVVVMRDVIDDSIYANQPVEVILSKWDDNDNNGAIDDALTELTEIGGGSYELTGTDIIPITGKVVTIDLENTATPGSLIHLDADSKYWLRVKVGGTNTYGLGTDYFADYTANINFGRSEGNPTLSSTIFMGGFDNAGSPAVALLMNTNKAEGVSNVLAFAGNVNVYPNPTSNLINVNLELDNISSKVTYEILDVTGKRIASASKNNIKADKFTFNTQSLSAGSYFVNIITEAGNKQVKFTVAK